MPIDPSDALGSDVELVFASDLPGTVWTVQTYQYYEAEEVRDETGTDYPEYGLWLPVQNGEEPAFVQAPLALREELDRLEAEDGRSYEVETAVKPGPNDNWEVSLAEASDDKQTRL